MSTEYDDKIVRMQFDNKQFEAGVNETLKSLDELKQSLKFDKVVSGIDTMASSVKNISFDNLTNGVEQVVVKIPVMGTIMDQTIRKMTDAVTNFVTSSLEKFSTLGNAMSGFSEYELQIGSVKTIKASTGESVETINKYLEELNKYADDTIYSFSDMTQNIGKFTNAGVKLDSAVAAIKGVANVAAVSGANTQEASRAMYNFAQALSAGYVKLIDWKSIETANMATVEFKNELIKTGLELGTLRQEGNKYVTTTVNMNGKVSEAFDATSNFDEALNNQWMTTDVLVKTLNKYTDTTTEIGKKATEAATEVNTFHQAMGAIVEDLGSNWTESWKYIVGDFEDATEMWTKFKDAVSGLFKPAAEARNAMLKFWSTNRGGAKETSELTEEAKNKYKQLFEVARKGTLGDFGNGAERVRQLTTAGYDYAEVQGIINKMVSGEVKSWEDVAKAVEKTTDAESEEMTGREMALKGISNIATSLKNIFTALSDAWHKVFPRTTGEQLVEISRRFMVFTEKIKIGSKTAYYLEHVFKGLFSILDIGLLVIKGFIKGITTLASAILSLFPKVDSSFLKTSAHIGDMIYEFDQMLKKEGYIEKFFADIANYIIKFVKIVADAAKKIAGYIDLSPFIKFVDGIVGTFKNLFKAKDTTDQFVSEENESLSKLTDPKQSAKKLVDGINFTFKDIFKAKDTTDQFVAEEQTSINQMDETDTSASERLVDRILKPFEPMINFFKKVWSGIVSVFTTIKGILAPIIGNIVDNFKDVTQTTTFDQFLHYLKEGGLIVLIGYLVSFIKDLKGFVGKSDSVIKAITNVFDAMTVALQNLTLSVKAKAIKDIAISVIMMAGAVWILSKMPASDVAIGIGALGSIIFALSRILKSFSDFSIKQLMGISSVFITLSNAMLKFVAAIKILGSMKVTELIKGTVAIGALIVILDKFIEHIAKYAGNRKLAGAAASIVAISAAIDMLVAPIIIFGFLPASNIAKGMALVSAMMFIIVKMVNSLAKAPKIGSMKGQIGAILALALAIDMLMAPVLLFAAMSLALPQLIFGVLAVVTLIGALVVAIKLMSKWAEPDKMAGIAGTILAIALAIDMLMVPVLAFALLPFDRLAQGVGAVVFLLIIMAGIIISISNLVKEDDPANLLQIAIVMMAMAIAVKILTLTVLDLAAVKPEDLIKSIASLIFVIGILLASAAIASSSTILQGIGGLIVLTLIAYALIRLIELINQMDPKKSATSILILVGAFIALSAGLIVIGAALAILGKMSELIDKGTTALKQLGNAMLMIAGAIFLFIVAVKTLIELGADKFLAGMNVVIGALITTIIALVKQLIVELIAFLPSVTKDLVIAILKIITELLQAIAMNLPTIILSLIVIITALLAGLKVIIPQVIDFVLFVILTLIQKITDKIPEFVDKIIALIQKFADTLIERKDDIALAFWSVILAVLLVIGSIFQQLFKALGDFFSPVIDVFKSIINAVKKVWNGLIGFLKDIFIGIVEAFAGAWDNIKTIWGKVTDFFAWVWEQIKKPFKAIGGFFYRIFSNVFSTVKGIFSKMLNFGKWVIGNIVVGIVKGLDKGLSFIGSKIVDGLNWITDKLEAVAKFFGVDLDIGGWSWEGFTPPAWATEWAGLMASGGQLKTGKTAIVGEAGPELLSSYRNRTQVTPLTNSSTKSVIGEYFYKVDAKLAEIEAATKTIQNGFTKIIDDGIAYDDTGIRNEIKELNKSFTSMKEDIRGMKVVIDGRALVGQIVDPMDEALGRKAVRVGRRG